MTWQVGRVVQVVREVLACVEPEPDPIGADVGSCLLPSTKTGVAGAEAQRADRLGQRAKEVHPPAEEATGPPGGEDAT